MKELAIVFPLMVAIAATPAVAATALLDGLTYRSDIGGPIRAGSSSRPTST